MFRSYVEHFAMLSTKGCCVFNLPNFKRQLNHWKTNVLTEATVLGSIADAHRGHRKVGGLLISNEYYSWKWQLQTLCSKLRARADENNSYFLAIVLDQDGDNLDASHLAKMGGGCSKDALISEVIIVLSGPQGIERHDQQDILELISSCFLANFQGARCTRTMPWQACSHWKITNSWAATFERSRRWDAKMIKQLVKYSAARSSRRP